MDLDVVLGQTIWTCPLTEVKGHMYRRWPKNQTSVSTCSQTWTEWNLQVSECLVSPRGTWSSDTLVRLQSPWSKTQRLTGSRPELSHCRATAASLWVGPVRLQSTHTSLIPGHRDPVTGPLVVTGPVCYCGLLDWAAAVLQGINFSSIHQLFGLKMSVKPSGVQCEQGKPQILRSSPRKNLQV